MTSIFVAKLDFNVTNEQLKETFQNYGTVLKATVATDRETGKSRGFAFVEMQNEAEAKAAIEALDGFKFNGRPIAVKEAEQRSNDNRKPAGNFEKRSFTPSPRPSNDFKSKDQDEELPFRGRGADDATPIIDPLTFIKPVERNKSKEKPKDLDSNDSRKKSTKMDAYKKSGKNNRFFDDDDDEDWDVDPSEFLYGKPADLDDEEWDDEDWDEEYEEDED